MHFFPRKYLDLSLISDLVALPRGACFIFDTESSCDPLMLSKQSLLCECFSTSCHVYIPFFFTFVISTVCLHLFF